MRELRICHPSLFDKYFTLTIADGDLSQSELDGLIALTADAKAFQVACDALTKRGLLKIAFERLEAYKEHVPLQNMPMLIEALCNLSDGFQAKEGTFLEADTETHAYRLVYFGLKRQKDIKIRFEVLRDALNRSKGLALPVQIVSFEERNGGRETGEYEFLVQESDLLELRRVCVKKLRIAARKREFCRNPRLNVFLWRWSEWTTKHEVREWIANKVQNAKSAIWFLSVFLNEMHSWGHDHRVRYYISLPEIERFIDLETVTELTKTITEEKLSTKDARVLREFKKALNRRAEGKSDDAWKSEGVFEEAESKY